MSEYGYIPEAPEQSFGNNKGIFTPKDIYDLTRADKYTNYGQLELIETQTFSTSVAQIDFTDIKEDIYNVHLLTGTVIFGSGNADLLSMRFFESGVLETASVYQIATQLGTAGGYFTETRSTGIGDLYFGESSIEPQSFYCYIYNAGDSSKYTFTTMQSLTGTNPSGGTNELLFRFGSGVLPQASVVDGIRLFGRIYGANIGEDFDVSLYGIRYS